MTGSAHFEAQAAPDKSSIARDFGAASGTYNPAARLQRYMGEVMLDRVEVLPAEGESPSTALDLGCGTGWFTGEVAARSKAVQTLGADLAPGMIHFARSAGSTGLNWLAADAEALPLADHSVDLIFSNLMIQWAENPRRVLAECRRVLRPGGQLMISTLLDGTLDELREAWRRADPDHQHVNRFDTAEDYQQWATAELPGATLTRETVRLDYPSPMALLAELKAIGAGFKGASRRSSATAPGRLRAMCRYYPVSGDGQIHATYEAAWLSCRLPDSITS
ncbi:malonyl-ACP O-methyltransferase BioC [Marinobacter confluentis]|uniref:Malonyl-[acyl-carrier protein] O-methyltransferase n=1 Tax=Marinobacter confluentis TaxID=1697557 RepID=A0A4Z1BR33_9GAMM|nr:malonyl-ACP O-methyltransferase BioC [Marinobacter confluentis]TGN40045.1 malonyl-ACP O-methyltransferase BioC [Marinobacter confluentis]